MLAGPRAINVVIPPAVTTPSDSMLRVESIVKAPVAEELFPAPSFGCRFVALFSLMSTIAPVKVRKPKLLVKVSFKSMFCSPPAPPGIESAIIVASPVTLMSAI